MMIASSAADESLEWQNNKSIAIKTAQVTKKVICAVVLGLFDFAVSCPSCGPVLTVSRSFGFDSFQSVQVGQRGDENKNAADGGGYNNQ